MTKRVICNSCGAEFGNNEPKCPYCGTMNYDGAEKEYLEKLEDVREDMEDLKEVSAEETKKEIKKQGKFIKKIVIIVAIFGLIILGYSLFIEKLFERDEKADYIWKSENYPIMNEMYENGEYEELAEFYIHASEDDKPVYDWEHYSFVSTYVNIQIFYDDIAYIESQEDVRDTSYILALSGQLRIVGAANSSELTEEEKAYFADDFEVVEEHLKNDWDFDEETYQEFYNEAVGKGYVDFSKCEEYVKKWMKGEN